MAIAPDELDRKMRRRAQECRRSSYCEILDARGDPETGAGVVVVRSTYSKERIEAHFFRPRQLKSAFRTERLESAHARMAVLERLRELLGGEKAARVAAHDLQVGEIVANIWGYTMRDARFYQVVDVPQPRKVTVVEIEARIDSGDWMAGTKVPVVPDAVPTDAQRKTYDVSMATGAPMLKTGSDMDRMTRWDGRPVHVYSD